MSYDDHEAVDQMDADIGSATDGLDAEYGQPPPGDEGFDISDAGGEYEAFKDFAQGLSELAGLYASILPSRHLLTCIPPATELMIATAVTV